MKNLLSFSIICVLLFFNEAAESAQKNHMNKSDMRWNVNKQAKQKELSQQIKLPRQPSVEKMSKKRKQKKHAMLTLDMLDGSIPKLLNPPPVRPTYTEKYFSPNIEQLKFDRFCMNDDSHTVLNPNALDISTQHYEPLTYKQENLFIKETECFIPYGYTQIDQRILMDNENIFKVSTVPTIKYIGEKAFLNCTNLSHFEINGTPNITYIADSAFQNTNLKKVILPYGIKHIGNRAFSNCRSLEEIHIPSSISDIGFNIASECPNLRDVFLPHNATISLNLIPQSTLYMVSIRFKCITDGFLSPIGNFNYLNIHRKNTHGTYTNILINNGSIAYCTNDVCRNASLNFDNVTSNNTFTF